MPLCSRCRNEEARPGQRWGPLCHAEWMRKNRPGHRDLPEASRIRANCRSHSNVLIRRGKLVRPPLTENHHPDYTDPRNVVFLFPWCHDELHRRKVSRETS